MHVIDRREALKSLGVGTVSAWFGGLTLSSSSLAQAHTGNSTAKPFPLRDVRLLESEFSAAQARNARYLSDLDADRLLHNFRVNAGLEPKAPVYGGWESQEPWVDIRCHGHTLGHYLSACSMHYAATGDETFKARVDYVVAELAECQKAGKTGLVCAFPDGAEQLERSLRGEEFAGVPWYTMHKVYAGLRDAHVLANSELALEVLVGLSDWAWRVTEPLSDAQMQRLLDREHGGMNEILADVHVLTNDPKYLRLAERFSHRALLDPL
ncbi:MAG: glycosyl hydrolase, partial [Xanthomonadaceae bacterium]|nr:glycosyl hydrolase [Xanthomonadaceae bacterium]